METLAQPVPEEQLASNFIKDQLTLDFLLHKSATAGRPKPPANSVSAWKEVYICHRHWQVTNTEHPTSSHREAQAWKVN